MPSKNCAFKGVVWLSKYGLSMMGRWKVLFYGWIAAVLPCAFKGIITLTTELEYDSQNWKESKRGNTPALPPLWQRWGSQFLCSPILVDWDICKCFL